MLCFVCRTALCVCVCVGQVAPGIAVVSFRSQFQAASSFLRFSEFYESPCDDFYRNTRTPWTVDDYKAWARQPKVKASGGRKSSTAIP